MSGMAVSDEARQPGPLPRWVSFDCYGTLIDWETGVRKAFVDLGHIPSEESAEAFRTWERLQWNLLAGPYVPYAEILWASFRETVEQLGYWCPGYAGEAFVNSLSRWEPFPDAGAALLRLSRSCRLTIISNIDRKLLGQSLKHFPVRFDALITSEDTGAYKPDPRVFSYAVEQLGCNPSEIVHVSFGHVACGADYDLLPASAAGLRIVYLNRNSLAAPKIAVEAELASLEDLPLLWNL